MADASATTISGILLQEGDNPDDTALVVSYASPKLLPRERNYSIIERELLSIFFIGEISPLCLRAKDNCQKRSQSTAVPQLCSKNKSKTGSLGFASAGV